MFLSTLRRLLTTVVAAGVLGAGLQAVTTVPAHAGQVGVTVGIQGAGQVSVVEGSLEDGASYHCQRFDNQDQRVTEWCPRVRNSEAFEAWVWLRATPSGSPSGQWQLQSWRSCDTTRVVDGSVECGVHSGAFSSDERYPVAVFRDVVAPTVTNVKAQMVPFAQGRFTFTWDAPYSVRSECRFGGITWETCTPGLTRSFPEGPATLFVRAEDASGNIGPETAYGVVAMDTWFTARPAAISPNRYNELRFTSDSGQEFECSLDFEPFERCFSGSHNGMVGYGLSDGYHTVKVRSRNGEWVDQLPAEHSWLVDTTPPQSELLTREVSGTSATFTFRSWDQATGVAGQECRLTAGGVAGTWSACTSPMTYQGLADGTQVFEVRARDKAGHVEPEPAYHAWSVDGSAPETTLGGPTGFVLSDAAELALGSSEPGSTYSCTVDGADRACSGPTLSLAGLPAGTHVATAAARDAAGNTDATPAGRTWTVPHRAGDLERDGAWSVRRSSAAYGGRYVQATRKGATLSLRVTGARQLALVVSRGRGHGSVHVYAGKRRLDTVGLASRSARTRQVVRLPALEQPFTGTVRLVVATADRPVRVEGLGVATR